MLELIHQINNIAIRSSKFKTQLDPFTTNELFLKWQHQQYIDINQYINVGIEIIKLQNQNNRHIKKSYTYLNNLIQQYYLDLDNNTCLNYLSLARKTHLNDVKTIQQIYYQIDSEKIEDFKYLQYFADLQCNDLDLVGRSIDKLHDKIENNELNTYLYSLFVLFPTEQATLLTKLIQQKMNTIVNPIINPQNFVLLSQLYQNKNIVIPNEWKVIQTNWPQRETKQSQLQKEIQLLLNMVKISYEQEKVIDDLYQVDFYLPNEKIILEVNGPQHYIYDIEQENPQIETGKHFYKQMCLSSLGYEIKNICYLEFYKTKGVTAKLQYLREILEE